MELSKRDTQMAKGVAALGMVMLHLFCRLGELPYTPWIWIGEIPLIYYLGLFGDMCVPIYCFCSGYAHYLMADAQGLRYARRLPGKALRFLCNYWIVVVLFSFLGLIFDRTGNIPGSFRNFLGNFLIVGMSYNGAWWFVTIYLILLALSPVLAALTKRLNGIVLLAASLFVYFVAYVLRFNVSLTLPNKVLQWLWNQAVLLGTSQFGYFAGMILRKYGVIGKLREFFRCRKFWRNVTVLVLPLTAFVGHCMIQSAFVAPFTAAAVLAGLFLAKQPVWMEKGMLLLGRHSTNIWLVHMFFYLSLFPGFAFSVRYPVLVLLLMLTVCIAVSMVIEGFYRPVLKLLDGKLHICGG